jgi:protein phosphatase
VQRGDVFLLCSDGLSGMLPDAEIARVLGSSPPDEAVDRLIDLANQAGGTDNITVQIAEIPVDGRASARPAARLAVAERSGAGAPGEEAAAAGSLVRWAVGLALLLALLLLLFGGFEPAG